MADDPELDKDLDLDPPVDPPEEAEDESQDQETEQEVKDDDTEEEQTVDKTLQTRADDQDETVREPGRRERRITSQQEALRARDQQIADLNKRLDTVLAQTKAPIEPQETLAQREQRLALLDPIDRMRVEMQEAQNVSTRQMQAMAFTMQETSDKATYDAKSLVDPLYAKWGPKVETFLTELRAKGQNVAREQALKYLIGEAALAGRKVASGKQRQEAAGRMTRNRTQPGNARSDTQVDRRGGSDGTKLERRLENVQI